MGQEEQNEYFIDHESPAEMARLLKQDRSLTESMGGPLAEQEEETITQFHDVLDMGCGPGGWALDVAHRYGARVTGIDISVSMLKYANSLADTQRLPNAQFINMDVNGPLDFPDNSFDLVNGRLMAGFMSTKSWPKLLKEAQRILRPGGMVRLCEPDGGFSGSSTSAGLEKLNRAGARSSMLAGRSWSTDGATMNIAPMLMTLLRNTGFSRVQARSHAYVWYPGSEHFESHAMNITIGFKLLKPFFMKYGVLSSSEYDQAYEQTLKDLEDPNFSGFNVLILMTAIK